jgi:hypothetical protein
MGGAANSMKYYCKAKLLNIGGAATVYNSQDFVHEVQSS